MHDDLQPIAEAFSVLTVSRPVTAGLGGVTLGHIPLTEIKTYLELFPVDDREEFVWLIRCMDSAYLKRHSERRTSQSDQRS